MLGKTYTQFDYVLIGKSNGTDHSLVEKVREVPSLSEQAAQKFNIKNSIRLKSLTAVQFWKTWMIMWTSIGTGKILEEISKLQPKRV
jgi:hypothetical protein